MTNQAIKRERHPMPTVEDLVHKLNGATVFSKLDLRSGYHQLTAVISPPLPRTKGFGDTLDLTLEQILQVKCSKRQSKTNSRKSQIPST